MGHGPSLLEKPQGKLIDSFDFVVRQKHAPRGPYLGSKCDAVLGSWNQMRSIPEELWVFIDSRFEHLREHDFDAARKRFDARIDADLCRKWDAIYRDIRTPLKEIPEYVKQHPRASDEFGHRHMSSGLHAIIYACEFLEPDTVHLIGFDNVKSGEFTWSITRGASWKAYPDHRWDVEHAMLEDIEREWNVGIEFV